ncbi:MAG TPA: helix-turn-helix transcriptional regulator [Candidatus Saccharimonadales bacterium]|nr:helix-turn-helix transcriptional regulator [Candidatus Saccharimonadales bacterium]
MSDTNKSLPYEPLGSQLRHLRERSRESVAEVSGAVEIDEKALTLIEAGSERPSEDILLLLISHFALEDDKAAELWELAGYDRPRSDDGQERGHEHDTPSQQSGRQQTLMVMIDPRVMYSDAVEVAANQKGIILNFSQSGAQADQPLTVARIGMSHEQAKLVMGILHQALYNADNPRLPKQLGDGSDTPKGAS